MAFHYNLSHRKVINFDENEFRGLDLIQLSAFLERVCSKKGSDQAKRNQGLLIKKERRVLPKGIFLQLSYFFKLILSAGVLFDYETEEEENLLLTIIYMCRERDEAAD